MAEKVLMLALSPTMEEGTIIKWLKKEGDAVKIGDVLCEVETDKASMDYESSQGGILLKIAVAEGGGAKVGEPIAIIGKKGEDISGLLAGPGRTAGPAASSAAVGAPGPAAAAVKVRETESGANGGAPGTSVRVKSSPLARVLAEQAGIDLARIQGTGPAGRVVKRDVESASASSVQAPSSQAGLRSESVPVSGKRKVIAERLSQSMFSAPHYYVRLAVQADGLLRARSALNARREKKVSINAFLMKFAAEAIKRYPMVNSSWQGASIQLFGAADIGLAVAQPDGLITPVVRDCGSKGLLQIDAELSGLIERALANKLKPEEYGGATFTISNLGSFGIDEFTAVINPPGSAILAVGSIKKEPVVGPDDRIEARTLMRLTLSCDHRVIDGALGANFLKYLGDIIEEPVRILY